MREIANQQKYILQQKNVVAGKNLSYIVLTMVYVNIAILFKILPTYDHQSH